MRRLCSCRLCVFRCLSVSALDYRTHRGAPSHWFGMRVVFFLQTFNPLRLINISFWSLQSLSALNCKNKTQTGERNLIISMKTQLQQQRQKSLTLRMCRTRTAFRKQRCECRLSSDKNKLNIKKKSRRDVLLIRGSFCSSRLPETEMEDVTKRLTMWLKHVKSNLQFLNNVWNTDSTTGRALGAFDWSTSENTTQSYLMSLRCFQSVKHIYKLNSNSDLVTFSHKNIVYTASQWGGRQLQNISSWELVQ